MMIKKNCDSNFSSYVGALRGFTPAEGGSGKANGFEARGETSPLLSLLYDKNTTLHIRWTAGMVHHL